MIVSEVAIGHVICDTQELMLMICSVALIRCRGLFRSVIEWIVAIDRNRVNCVPMIVMIPRPSAEELDDI